MTHKRPWRSVQVYNPTVVCRDGRYQMWFLGNGTATRTSDMDLGYAESEDGVNWVEHSQNPILRTGDLPWGRAWQTPHVLFDVEEDQYKMWFIMADSQRDKNNEVVFFTQRLGYATSIDGLSWDVHPEALLEGGRRPCVLKSGDGSYRMWMNAAPDPEGDFRSAARHIFGFSSPDGLVWTQDEEPAVQATELHRSVVYPFVHRNGSDHTMWYGCHVDGGVFQIYSSTSDDGVVWQHHHDAPAFEATRDPNHFDGRYTSTPCVLEEADRYLLYYSARDWGNIYGAGDGTLRVDSDGIYRHIGVAICDKRLP
ncbi:MAG: hypothetical protein HOC05_00745 [Gemmatimonadetes bacterium]|nr:hypothetical protein [Gemmatimonadota bacterium]